MPVTLTVYLISMFRPAPPWYCRHPYAVYSGGAFLGACVGAALFREWRWAGAFGGGIAGFVAAFFIRLTLCL